VSAKQISKPGARFFVKPSYQDREENFMNHVAAAVLLIAFWMQSPSPSINPGLPDTPAGKLVSTYLEAFNAGEAAMRGFIERYVAKDDLERTAAETRLARFRQMKQRLGRLKPVKVLQTSDTSITLDLKSSDGPLVEFTFELAPTSPPTLRGIRVEDRGEGESAGPARDPKASDQEWVASVGSYLDQSSSQDEFSGAVLLARGDQLLFEKAYGLADKSSKAPNRIDTRFNLGSINKIFTNIAIHQLAAQGKLALEDRIAKFLPDYPNRDAAAKVTIKQLLSMSSGIGDFFGDRYEQTAKEKIRSIADYFPLFADKPLEFEPGTSRRYSNGGYIVLGAIIEKVSGIDYYSYVRKNIYEPAGMKDSDWFEKDKLPPNTAIGYTDQDRQPNYASLPGRGSSAGGGYSTLRDLFSFVKAMKKGVVTTPDFQPDGLGIAGGAPGMNAILDSGRDYVLVVLSNYDPPTAERAARQIRAWMPR